MCVPVVLTMHLFSGLVTGIVRFQEGQLEEKGGFFRLRHVRLDRGQVRRE